MEKLAEKERELETLKVTMKVNGMETQASSSDTERAAGNMGKILCNKKSKKIAVKKLNVIGKFCN